MEIYSKIDRLPRGTAPDTVTPGCLVLEGGAFRAVYGEGVCDALMQEGLNFETTVGVSAGALNAISYLSGQIGRTARINLHYRHDPSYVGLKPWAQTRSFIGFDYLFRELSSFEPLDEDRFFDPRRRFYVETTCCDTGTPAFFEKNDRGNDIGYIYRAIQASASMPYISKMVEIDGQHHLDGGCHTRVPFRWALDRGHSKVVVVRTRNRNYRKKDSFFTRHMPGIAYRNYPEFAQALVGAADRYNRDCEVMDRLEAEGRIFVIAPSRPVSVGRLEPDMEKLGDLYQLGYRDAKAAIVRLRQYLDG